MTSTCTCICILHDYMLIPYYHIHVHAQNLIRSVCMCTCTEQACCKEETDHHNLNSLKGLEEYVLSALKSMCALGQWVISKVSNLCGAFQKFTSSKLNETSIHLTVGLSEELNAHSSIDAVVGSLVLLCYWAAEYCWLPGATHSTG